MSKTKGTGVGGWTKGKGEGGKEGGDEEKMDRSLPPGFFLFLFSNCFG